MISAQAFEQVLSKTNAVMVDRVFGNAGVAAFFTILNVLRELYRHVELSRFEAKVTVFSPLPDASGFFEPTTGTACTDFSLLVNCHAEPLVLGLFSKICG